MGRPPTCTCGGCPRCRKNARERERYAQLTAEERTAVRKARDPQKVRATDRRRFQRDRTRNVATTRRWREEDRRRSRAHNAVRAAVRRGDLERLPCEVCGTTESVHAHHDDYDKPLEVRWLCPVHHAAERTASGR